MRVSSVIVTPPSFSSVGTLKSTRTSALRLRTSMSLIESFGIKREELSDGKRRAARADFVCRGLDYLARSSSSATQRLL